MQSFSWWGRVSGKLSSLSKGLNPSNLLSGKGIYSTFIWSNHPWSLQTVSLGPYCLLTSPVNGEESMLGRRGRVSLISTDWSKSSKEIDGHNSLLQALPSEVLLSFTEMERATYTLGWPGFWLLQWWPHQPDYVPFLLSMFPDPCIFLNPVGTSYFQPRCKPQGPPSPLPHWGYHCISLHLAFLTWVMGTKLGSLCCEINILPTEPSSQIVWRNMKSLVMQLDDGSGWMEVTEVCAHSRQGPTQDFSQLGIGKAFFILKISHDIEQKE